LTLRQLELFLALVKTPHLSQVAKDFGLTQSRSIHGHKNP